MTTAAAPEKPQPVQLSRPATLCFARPALGVFVLLLVAFGFLGSRSLWSPDEGRYALVALNMLDSGDWLVPTLLDGQPHFTKPPLTYWLIAASLKLFGVNEWAARLPNAVAWIGTVLLTFGIARIVVPSRAKAAMLMVAAMPMLHIAAGILTTDTILTFCETLAMYCFVRAWWGRPGKPDVRWIVAMWAAWGLAFMVKGPPGLLPLLAVVVFVAVTAHGRGLLTLFNPLGLLAFAAVGLSWYLAVIVKHPGLLDYYLRDELYGRVVAGQHGRHEKWYEGFTVYGPVLLLGGLPWIAIPLWRWRRSLRAARVTLDPRNYAAQGPRALLALWFALPLLVFMVASSRLELYVLPLFVPLALLIAMGPGLVPLLRRAWPLVALLALLVFGRAIAAWAPHEKDSRRLAEQLVREIPSLPDHIVFVDMDVEHGVGFYLRRSVTRVEAYPEDETEVALRDWLKRNEPARAVFITKKSVADRTEKQADRVGVDLDIVGEFDDLVFLLEDDD